MDRRYWLLLIPMIITVHGLVTGAGWLLAPTPGVPALPLGNSATWGVLVCLAALVLLRRPAGWLRRSAWLAAALALSWGPVGYLLAGNWRFSFEGGRDGTGWWYYCVALAALVFLNLGWSLVTSRGARTAASG